MSSERKFLRGCSAPLLLQSSVEPPSPGFDKLYLAAAKQAPCSATAVRFGPFEVNLERRELRKHGLRMKLEDKPFEILEALLREPGRLVSRSELRARLWPDTFVSYEHCLNTAINKLRFVLGESSASFRFVETVRRRGYRFVGALQNAQPQPSPRVALLVLPFRAQCSRRALEPFADGLTEEVSAELGKLDPLRLGVIAVSTAMLYKGAECSVAEIAKKAGADLIVEGSLRRDGDRVRATLHLVRASGQMSLWSEIYDGSLIDPFACQAEIAKSGASAVAAVLGLPAQRTTTRRFGGPISLSVDRIRKLS